MPFNIDQTGNFETVTYQLDEGEYEAVITDLKRKISVNAWGTSEIEAYSNALQKLEDEEQQI